MGTEFDTDNLLRMDSVTQVTAIKDAVGAGVMSPNEGRGKLDLKPVNGGESPYLQQQNYSLEALAKRDAQDDPFAPANRQHRRRNHSQIKLHRNPNRRPPKGYHCADVYQRTEARRDGQPLALESLAAASVENSLYYHSGKGIFAPVSLGGGLIFDTGTLSAPGGGATRVWF